MKPNVLLMVIDSFRADKFYGKNKTSITPNIDHLIKNGLYFSQAISSAPASIPAVSSILTGLYPFSSLKLQNKIYNLNPTITTFVHKLKQIGYDVHATIPKILTLMTLQHVFDENINSYDDDLTLYDGVGENIINKLQQLENKEPWFYYLHINDIHGQAKFHKDFIPNQFYDKKFGVNQYERMVSLMDIWIGNILKNLDLTKTMLILTADHGSDVGTFNSEMERFSQNNIEKKTLKKGLTFKISHKLALKLPKLLQPLRKRFSKKYIEKRNEIINNKIQPDLDKIERSDLRPYEKRVLRNIVKGTAQVYDEKFRIPLLFTGHGIYQPKIIESQVRSVDIFLTVFDLLGFKPDFPTHGKSLVPLIHNKKFEESFAYVESATNETGGYSSNVIGIRTSKFKYFRHKDNPNENIHLYDLTTDPLEEFNISYERKDIVKEMESILQKLRATNNIQITNND